MSLGSENREVIGCRVFDRVGFNPLLWATVPCSLNLPQV
ncbi:hypothetical protein SPLC1_S032320 [Arthrospira platensis C1]|nr:hypothetical protein SPLC1_S032320 [Arthrospira platensis C1]